MKAADRSGARWAVVLGDRDLEAGVAPLRDLRSGEQQPVPLDDLVSTVLQNRAEEPGEPTIAAPRDAQEGTA
jgi:histidyl-tRNA synthetase